MRILHTADWHLGRQLYDRRLIEDQAHALGTIIEICQQERPEAVVVAGDVFDRSVPPHEAVTLLDWALSEIALGLGIPTLLIAGNHDSPERLGFGSKLLTAGNVHVRGPLHPDHAPIVLSDAHGPVAFHLVPYVEPPVAREVLRDASLATHQDVMTRIVADVWQHHPCGARSVLVGHAFVDGGIDGESERPLSIGGADRVLKNTFDGFDYVALGHLHRPQPLYSGSLLKYAFDEAGCAKSVTMVEMDACGRCATERLPLPALRDLRALEGTIAEIIASAGADPRRDDYVMARLTDAAPVIDAMARLREVYPNALHVERPGLRTATTASAGRHHAKRSPVALFESFYAAVMQEEIDPAMCCHVGATVEGLEAKLREAAE